MHSRPFDLSSTGRDSGVAVGTCRPNASTLSAPATLEQVLDPAALAQLRQLDPSGNSGLLARVLSAFDASLTRLLGQLIEARKGADMAVYRHVAHTLKSSSASVGALELSRLCAEVEGRARDQRSDGLEPLLDAMVAEAARLLGALQTFRKA